MTFWMTLDDVLDDEWRLGIISCASVFLLVDLSCSMYLSCVGEFLLVDSTWSMFV